MICCPSRGSRLPLTHPVLVEVLVVCSSRMVVECRESIVCVLLSNATAVSMGCIRRERR